LGIALLLAIGGLSTWKYLSDRKAKEKIALIEKKSKQFKVEQDSIETVLKNTEKNLLTEKERNKKIQDNFERRLRNFQMPAGAGKPVVGSITTNNKSIEACQPYVYFVYVSAIEVMLPNGERKSAPESMNWTGTGFLLDDGRFVTARHVIEPWFFLRNDADSVSVAMNYIANNGGKIIVHFNALSSSGDRLSFTNEQVVCNRSHDRSGVTDDGYKYAVTRLDNADWAYFRSSKTGGLTAGKSQSIALELGTELTVLGFPFMLGANSSTDIKPILSKATAAKSGLDNGLILTTNSTYEQGNSGGPVFYTDSSGKLIVIGIVSAGAGRSTGFIVPIASIDYN
jgi:S1-C subfamily serine protease